MSRRGGQICVGGVECKDGGDLDVDDGDGDDT